MKENREKILNSWMKNIGLILVTLLLAVACSTPRHSQIVSDRPETLKGQILVWADIQSGISEAYVSNIQTKLEDMLENFQELHPQTQVFLKYLPVNQIWEQFESEVNRGAGPDMLIVQASAEVLRFIQSGAISAVEDSEIDSSRFRSEALKQVTYRNQLYGIPLHLETQVLCYNRDKVSELPRSLSELLEQVRKGYSVGVQSGFSESFWGTGIFGGQLFDDGGRLILAESGGWAQWMTWLRDAQNEPNFILSNEVEALLDAFAEGDLAYLTCWPEWMSYFENLGLDSLGATLLPGELNQPATPILQGRVLLFNRYSSANQKQLALILAQFLTNVEQQKQGQVAFPMIPSNRYVMINAQLFPLRSTILEQAKTAVALALDDAEIIQSTKDARNSLYRQVLSGEIDPDEAASQLEQAVSR